MFSYLFTFVHQFSNDINGLMDSGVGVEVAQALIQKKHDPLCVFAPIHLGLPGAIGPATDVGPMLLFITLHSGSSSAGHQKCRETNRQSVMQYDAI